MEYIYQKFNIDLSKNEIISFVGAGGKTTTIEKLSKELSSLNKKVLVTTSTAMFNPNMDIYENIFIGSFPEDYMPKDSSITFYADTTIGKKVKCLEIKNIEKIIKKDLFDYILIEADGSREKPIKAPNETEPVITNYTTKTVGVIGLDSLGKPIKEICHRPEIFCKLTNRVIDDYIDINSIINLVKSPIGLFKNAVGDKILYLNKIIEISDAIEIESSLKDVPGLKVVFGEMYDWRKVNANSNS
ncbi:MAG: putative selenium-dependent hydroxylase accessory protein YqeC [Tissierellales bacterium]|nr:putative selenium-dependent hydroxylase accessory protein YqeC [Tissierellales bacterium]